MSLPRASQRRVRWHNGAGWTTELAVRPDDGGPFHWRVSVAEIEGDCEFSCFPGVDRSIIVLAGGGFELFVDGEPPATLRAGGPPHAFPGDRAARCAIAGRSSRAFNVMTRRGVVGHALTICRAGQSVMLARAAGTIWVVYAFGGAARLGERVVTAGEGASVEYVRDDMSPWALSADGDVALVQLRPG